MVSGVSDLSFSRFYQASDTDFCRFFFRWNFPVVHHARINFFDRKIDHRSPCRQKFSELANRVEFLSALSSADGGTAESSVGLTQLDNMSPMDIKKAISINKDPAGEQLLVALGQKISREFSEAIESNKRSRSLVISGIEETEAQFRPSERQRDLGRRFASS